VVPSWEMAELDSVRAIDFLGSETKYTIIVSLVTKSMSALQRSSSPKRWRWRATTYWISTGIIAAEFAVGGIMDLLQSPPFFEILRGLGYPDYFSIILGVWKLPAAVTVLVPRFPRLKEWAYAGMFFTMAGAALSHFAVGDSAIRFIPPVVFATLVMVSWSLRPPARYELSGAWPATTKSRPIIYWVATIVLATECFVGGIMGLLRVSPFVSIMHRLGYPTYLTTILGVSYLLAGIAIVLLRFSRAKEWAYAGLIFIYSGAAVSRLVAHDGVEAFVGPTILSALVLTSWALRPPTRSSGNMKSNEQLHQKLRQRILSLPGVTEKQNAGIHEDAFYVAGKMFMHIHGSGHCDIRLSKDDQARALLERKARVHRWAPSAGYVTFKVRDENDLKPAMELIQISHDYVASSSR
jgi:uncharacterized membrane protein YphA (DoxX/SURF4 family)